MKRFQLFALSYDRPPRHLRDVMVQADTLEALFAAYRAAPFPLLPSFEVLDMERREWLTEPSAMIDCANEAEASALAADYGNLGFYADVCPGEGSNGRIYGVQVSC